MHYFKKTKKKEQNKSNENMPFDFLIKVSVVFAKQKKIYCIIMCYSNPVRNITKKIHSLNSVKNNNFV